MMRITIFIFLLFCNTVFAKNYALSMSLGARLMNPTCNLTASSGVNFGNINRHDFVYDNVSLTKVTSITTICAGNPRMNIMFIPQHGILNGLSSAALTANSSVIYSIWVGNNTGKSDFNVDDFWPYMDARSLRITLQQYGPLFNGDFSTSLTIQLTYI